ncbi:MAG: hypothetical protein H6747_16865, partial [Deltaproteobacteria bacterium]|nr:hypothetical protein [Deltaproteobacteria bacterium]
MNTITVRIDSDIAGQAWVGRGRALPPARVDGAEGGGQILRTALAVSALTGRALEMRNIRGARRRPGLMRQHLTAVRAAAEICDAETDGASLGSTTLRFRPGTLRGGQFVAEIGSAGSACLVAQTVAPALLLAPEPSEFRIGGGT